MSIDLARTGLETATQAGAAYADIRIGEIRDENLTVKNGVPDETEFALLKGFGVRVIVDGAWGFAASVDVTPPEVTETARRAVAIARASARVQKTAAVLREGPTSKGMYTTPMQKDPFTIPLEDKMAMLMAAERTIAQQSPRIKTAYAYFRAKREHKLFLSTEGAEIRQQITWCGGGLMAVALSNGEAQRRSYPSSFRGNFSTRGYEFFEALDLTNHAQRVGREAVQLLDAPKCPSGTSDLIIAGDQLALQVHESCGHPTELDRALGMEADYAGTSFLTPDQLHTLQYGSEHVNIVADATVPGGLGTFGYDDEGTPAKQVALVKHGLFVGYQSSRETAAMLDLDESSGGMRADSPLALPLIRMTNINLLPGDWTADDLVDDTRDGLLMETNRSWSIDDRRLNFQFGTEIGWIIKHGSKDTMVRNPTYTGMTPAFWGSCDAVSKDDWMMWGTPNCGKGVPGQVMYVGHGCGSARFRQVRVGLIK
jgi:TldD protein